MITINFPNLTYMPYILHRYSSSETAHMCKILTENRQLIMEILHLKLGDLNLTFKDHTSAKILR